MGRRKKNITEGAKIIEGQASENRPRYIVEKSFRDIKDFSKQWDPGTDVSHFGKSRLDHLVSIGMVKKV